MKISNRQGRRRTAYGWAKDGAYFLSLFSSFVPDRPRNTYVTKEDAEAEAAARNFDIVWENDIDG